MKKIFTCFKIYTSIIFSLIIVHSVHSQTIITRLQIIHNVADPDFAVVDLYMDDVLIKNDMAFREATAFMTVNSAVPIKFSVAPSNSTSSAQAVKNINMTFPLDTRNVIILSGVEGTGYASNPDGRNTDIDFIHYGAAKEFSLDPANVEWNFFHGLTDAPVIDVLVQGQTAGVNNIGYGDYSGYISVPQGNYTLNITDQNNTATIATVSANMTNRGGQAATIFFSGFLNPDDNNDGVEYELFAAFPDGTVLPLDNAGVTSISQRSQSFSSIKAFPVPTSDFLTIEVNDQNSSEAAIEVFNVYGQPVLEKVNTQLISGLTEIRLDLSSLNSGEYVIKTTSNDRIGVLKCFIVK